MEITHVMLLFGLVVLVTHFLEGITGFGCTALALPFCIALAGLKTAVPTLVILAWALALYVVVIDFKNLVWREFLKILALVLLGLPVGIAIFHRLPVSALKRILGVFMLTVSAWGLYTSFKGAAFKSKIKIPKPIMYLFLFLGGIIHGAFGSGGPFVVLYATGALEKKGQFRATLCALWLVLNTVIIAQNIAASVITPAVLTQLLVCVPFLAGGMVLGNRVHGKVRQEVFLKIIYGVLFFSGLFMAI